MGNACQCQQAGSPDRHEILSARMELKDKRQETITIINNNGGTISSRKFITKEGNQEQEEDEVQDDNQQIEMKKRGDKKKRAKINVVSDKVEIFENISVKQQQQKSPFDYQLILNGFNEHFIFKAVPPEDIQQIVEKMFYCTVPDGQFVFKQGDTAALYFMIERGQCQIIINEQLKKTLKRGEAFGELALLYNAPRSASVKAVGDCAFWAIDRNTFRNMVEQQNLKNYEENREFLKKVEFFSFLTEEQRDAICSVLITLIYKKGEIIVNQNDVANSFYIIKKGKVTIIQGNLQIGTMAGGESFGESALSQNSTRAATVKALDEEVRCLSLSREDITRILGQQIQTVRYINIQKWALQNHPIFSKLTNIQIEKIIQSSRQVKYLNNQIVLKAKSTCTKIYIMLEGELISSSNQKTVVTKGTVFGDQYIQSKKQVPEDLIVKESATISEFEISAFLEVIGGSVEQMIVKNEKSHEQRYMMRPSAIQNRDFSHIKLDNLVAVKKLGAGQFGNVYLTKCTSDDKLYALKCISKAQIVEQHLERHLAQEKQVLNTINFPFMMTFYRSLKDNNYIYFVEEYIKGMELFDVIREIGLLSTSESQFYIGSLILCVEYLHKQLIIYRDIKPENIMVDDKGFIRMIDMGTAKFLNQKSIRTYTIIGTPHYMAPEIITGKGYTFNVDLWSIGICLYEFMCGGVPYAEDADDPYEIYEEIMKKNLQFPGFMKDRKAKKIVDQLLSKTPELRLAGSYAALKANQWFDRFDWDKLIDKELKSPFIPKKTKMVSEKDIQNAMSQNRLACKEINSVGVAYKRERARDPNWDKDY